MKFLGMTIALVASGVAAGVTAHRRRRWAQRSGSPALAAWAAARGFRLTAGDDLEVAESLERVLDVAGRPGDTAGGLALDGGDQFHPLTRPEVGCVLVGVDQTLVFDAWVGGRGYVYAAGPGRSAWISLEAGDASASGPGATSAVHPGLLAGLVPPSRIRCGCGWRTVSAAGALDAATADALLARLADVHGAVAADARL